MKVTSGPPAENVNETLVYRYMSKVLTRLLKSQDAQKKPAGFLFVCHSSNNGGVPFPVNTMSLYSEYNVNFFSERYNHVISY